MVESFLVALVLIGLVGLGAYFYFSNSDDERGVEKLSPENAALVYDYLDTLQIYLTVEKLGPHDFEYMAMIVNRIQDMNEFGSVRFLIQEEEQIFAEFVNIDKKITIPFRRMCTKIMNDMKEVMLDDAA